MRYCEVKRHEKKGFVTLLLDPDEGVALARIFNRLLDVAGKRLTKAQIITELANATDLDKKTVNRLFDEIFALIKKQLSPRGPGEFVVPGLVKLRVVKKAATKELVM